MRNASATFDLSRLTFWHNLRPQNDSFLPPKILIFASGSHNILKTFTIYQTNVDSDLALENVLGGSVMAERPFSIFFHKF